MKDLESYIKEYDYTNDYDVQNRENFMDEISEAIRNYIQTGVESKQLVEFIKLENTFYNEYSRLIDYAIFTKDMIELSAEQIADLSNHTFLEIENIKNQDHILEKIINRVLEYTGEKLQHAIANVAYMSNINTLYEIYEKENSIRKEQKQFQEKLNKTMHSYEITIELSKNRRMELREIQKKMGIPKKELEDEINASKEFFNIRNRDNITLISLTPKGKRFKDYISYQKSSNFTKETNQLVYNNCCAIIEAIENAYEMDVDSDVDLNGIPSEEERAIKRKLHGIVEKVMSDQQSIYSTKELRRRLKSEKMEAEYEKGVYTIEKRWIE